jgi:phospholipid/cholesterol/gamma-HCH transport system substrate-binding protein
MANTLDKSIQEDSKLVHDILVRADQISEDVRKVTAGADRQVDKILDNIEAASAEAKVLVETTKGEITMTGESVREKLDKIDKSLAALDDTLNSSRSIAKKIDGEDPEDRGTLGVLVNDPTIAENIEQITEDAKGFTQSLFGLQTIVGLRSEWNFISQAARSYLSIELHTRPDRYYLVEVVSDQRSYLDAESVWDEANQQFVRTTTVDEDSLRFSLMYAKKWEPFTFRMGIKESSGGVGLDVRLGPVSLSSDLFDFRFDELPRLRVVAMFRLHRYFYILGGVDDVLNDPDEVPITGGDVTGGFTSQYHFGRDVFGGAMLRFTDDDLKTLLFVAGSALSGATD